MVRQFADPYAFVRELVQNGIDAGATRLEVRAEMRHDGGVALSVSDDGEGMTQQLIEGPLLTLFNSAKDGQEGKIGKYGIGFVSVFGIDPREVIVDTWRAEGSWRLTLQPDHSYELAVGRQRSGSGTTVTLLVAPSSDEAPEHADRMYTALVRWCRHAKIPIHWTRQAHDKPVHTERIDRALDVISPLIVRAEIDGAQIIVGASPGEEREDLDLGDLERAESFLGFYNHGLTLYETATPAQDELVGMRVKILSDALQHTLSRDNVRHDRAYHRAIANAIELSKKQLVDKLRAELAGAAETAARGNVTRYRELLHIALRGPINLGRKHIVVPLTDPIDGVQARIARDCKWSNGSFARAAKSTLATRTLAQQGVPVVLASTTAINLSLRSLFGGALREVDTMFSVVSPAEHNANAQALCGATRHAMRSAGYKIEEIELGSCDGVAVRAAVGCESGQVLLLDRAEWPDWFSRWHGAKRVRIIAEHEAVARALSMVALGASSSATVAGTLLARYLIVETRGEVSADANDALLALTLERPA